MGYLILRRQGDEIAAYAPGWRSIGDLKADGTFHWSSSAFNNGTGRARFDGGEFAVEEISWCKDGLNHGVADPRFYADGVRVSQEEFEAAQEAQDAKARGGIALCNVNNRIHLLFGEEYGLRVFSVPGVGTDVEILLPAITSDRDVPNKEALRSL